MKQKQERFVIWAAASIVALLVAVFHMGGDSSKPSVPVVADAATASPTDSPTESPATPKARPTVKPTPKIVDHHDERASDKGWWSTEGLFLAQANDTFMQAREKLGAGDIDGATEQMHTAMDDADKAIQASEAAVPNGWDDVSSKLNESARDFKETISDMLAMIVNTNRSDGERGLAANEAAKNAADDATHLARVHYADLGGATADIISIADMADGLESIRSSVQSAASSGNSDGSQ